MVTSQLVNGRAHDTVPEVNGNGSTTCLRRLLVIEDERDAARLVEFTLQRAGYEVYCAGTVDEAFAIIEQVGLPHLAVVDIMLPGGAAVQRPADHPAECD
jgi:CheY-like chemotaxis protein